MDLIVERMISKGRHGPPRPGYEDLEGSSWTATVETELEIDRLRPVKPLTRTDVLNLVSWFRSVLTGEPREPPLSH